MSTNLISVSFRIDAKLKHDAEKLFESLGMNMTTAFNIFLKQSVRERGIPFDITANVPNAETTATMEEAERLLADPNIKGYPVEEALRILKEDSSKK